MSEEPVDVLIIGAGAAGAAFAWSLAETRMNVLCLEQGEWMDPAKYPGLRNDWEACQLADFGISPNARGRREDYPVNDSGSPIQTSMFNAVGGSTIIYAAHFPRFHPSDFRAKTLDGVGDDWPVDYERLAPFYDIIEQAGLDAQLARGSMLWKAEMISRREQGERQFASTAGFEYTFTGVFGTPADIGILGEHLYDDRGVSASTLPANPVAAASFKAPPTPFQNDLFVGGRFTLNDVQSSQLLAGMIFDLDGRGRTWNVEAERRLGESWKLSVEWRGYAAVSLDDVLYTLRDDDSLRAELGWYF